MSPRPSPREVMQPQNPRATTHDSPRPSPREVMQPQNPRATAHDSPRPSPREVMQPQNPRASARDSDQKRTSPSPSPKENPGIPGILDHIPRRANQHQSLFPDGRIPRLDLRRMSPRLPGNTASPAKLSDDVASSTPDCDGQVQGQRKSPRIPDNKGDSVPLPNLLPNDSGSSRSDKRGWLQRNLTNIGLKKIARGWSPRGFDRQPSTDN